MIDPEEDELIRLTFDMRHVWRGDWTAPLMLLLRRGRMRYRDIRDEMAGYTFHDPWTDKNRTLSNSDLARTLARMTHDGWLIRTEIPGEWHSNVSYALSEEGYTAVEGLVRGSLQWGRANRPFFTRILRGRDRTGDAGDRHPAQRRPRLWCPSRACPG